MPRRVSSRDDLFLSALDMYTLLSLVFIGVAFMASYGAQERSVLNLPTLPPRARTPAAPEKTPEQLWVRWAGPADLRAAAGGTCHLSVVKAGPFPLPTDGLIGVPCWPRSFAGSGARSERLTQAAQRWTEAHPGQEPDAVILCRRDQLEACGRLQWVLAEHGFRPNAAVALEQP